MPPPRGFDLSFTDYHLRNGETGTQVIEALGATLPVPLKAVLVTGDTSSAIRAMPQDPHVRIDEQPHPGRRVIARDQDMARNIRTLKRCVSPGT